MYRQTHIYYWGRKVDTVHHISYRFLAVCGMLLSIGGLNLILGNPLGVQSSLLDPSVAYAKNETITTLGESKSQGQHVSKFNYGDVSDYICNPKFKWDCELAKHIAFCESSFNSKAKNPNGTASGLYQFTARTWKWVRGLMGRSKDLDLRFDYRESVDTAYKLYSIYGFDSTVSWHESVQCWK